MEVSKIRFITVHTQIALDVSEGNMESIPSKYPTFTLK